MLHRTPQPKASPAASAANGPGSVARAASPKHVMAPAAVSTHVVKTPFAMARMFHANSAVRSGAPAFPVPRSP